MNRRDIISAIALAPIAIAVPAAASLTTKTSVWDRAMADYIAAKGAADQFQADIYDPLYEKLNVIRPEYVIRHTAKNGTIGTYRFNAGEMGNYAAGDWDMYAAIRPQIDALIAQHQRYEAQYVAHDMDALNDRLDALVEMECAARAKLLNIPAPHHAAILWKMEILFGEDACGGDEGYTPSWSPEMTGQFFADVRRMGGRA
ncbi:hypothetical protein BH10PSE12_BH10PSE12_16610 [soil metagenome]